VSDHRVAEVSPVLQLPFPLTTYRDRMAAVRRAMAEQGLDVALVTMPDAVHWLTGIDSVGYLWPQALLVPARPEREPLYVTRTTEEPGVDACSWLTERYFYDISLEDPVEAIVGRFRGLAGEHDRIGLEDHAFTMLPATAGRIRAAFPDAEFVDCSYLVPEVRLVKSEAELAYQRRAAEIADHANFRYAI
jgi:Xaa-Pro dipeptidase